MPNETKRGGARPGAGRKKKDASGSVVTVSFCVSPAQKERLQKAVAQSGQSQSAYICARLGL